MSNVNDLEKLQNPYVDTMRKKIGEFMLIHNDLEEKRGVTLEPQYNDIINIDIEGEENVYSGKSIKEIAVNTIQNKATDSTKDTKDWADEFHISSLATLLYNNGFPCQIIINRLTKKQEQIEKSVRKFPETGDFAYKMPMVFAGASGESVDKKHNHYTFIIPTDMNKIKIPDELNNLLEEETTENIDGIKKYKTSGDGHCFYRAIANWCIIYGITKDHLENMTYNVPFKLSEEHFLNNLKVPNTTDAIPKPIPVPIPNDIERIAGIAELMLNKVKNLEPKFGEPKDITDSDEYKNYLENGVTKDNGTHCNKYKGNKKAEGIVEGTSLGE